MGNYYVGRRICGPSAEEEQKAEQEQFLRENEERVRREERRLEEKAIVDAWAAELDAERAEEDANRIIRFKKAGLSHRLEEFISAYYEQLLQEEVAFEGWADEKGRKAVLRKLRLPISWEALKRLMEG